jgi:hypothetical protein
MFTVIYNVKTNVATFVARLLQQMLQQNLKAFKNNYLTFIIKIIYQDSLVSTKKL